MEVIIENENEKLHRNSNMEGYMNKNFVYSGLGVIGGVWLMKTEKKNKETSYHPNQRGNIYD